MLAAAPKQSYIIWFSQRVGSTLLTQAVENTGLAGRPREWFNLPTSTSLLAHHGAQDAHELREILWGKGTTSGVFGVKYGFREGLHRDLTAVFTGVLPPGQPDPDGRAAWKAFFPRCQHVFMTRRNKLRLAVSWWRAIRTEDWHRPRLREPTVVDPPGSGPALERVPRPAPPELVDQYDYKALEHLFVEANLREAGMQDQFDRWNVVPHTITYEDFITAYEPSIRALLDFLQIPGRADIPIPAPAFDRLADAVSESWYHRFREERTCRLG